MIRVEELTTKLIDGELADDERQELGRLIEADAEARQVHVTLLRTETLLRARRPVDVSAAVMEKVRAQAAPKAARQQRPRRRWRWWQLLLPLAGTLAFAYVGQRVWRGRALLSASSSDNGGAISGHRSPSARTAPPRFVPAVEEGAGPPSGAPHLEAPQAPGAIAPPTPTPGPPPSVLVSWDFEDGQLPRGFVNGQIVGDVCPAASKFCLLGGLNWVSPKKNTVVFTRQGPRLFAHSDNGVITFDYRIGLEVETVTVQVFNEDVKQNFHLNLQDPVRGAWAHATLRLADFVGNVRPNDRMSPGDRIGNLNFYAGRLGGEPFYVDQINVLEYPPGHVPATTSRSK